MPNIDTRYMRQVSFRRIIWVFYVKITTFFIPTTLLGLWITKSRQQAWREKFSLFCTLLVICGLFGFWLEFITHLFCDPPPTFHYKGVYSNHSQLSSINGVVVDWHGWGNTTEMTRQVNLYPHQDLSSMFPTFMLLQRQPQKTTYSNSVIETCINGFNRSTQADNWLQYKLAQDPGYSYKDNQLISCPLPYQRNQTGASCFYTLSDKQEYQKYHKKGALEFTEKGIAANYSILPSSNSQSRAFVILDSKVLDVTDYLLAVTNIVQVAKDTQSRSFALDRMFLPLDLTILLFINLGKDISTDFHATIAYPEIYKDCLLELFYHGIVDINDDEGCARVNLALWTTMGCFLTYSLIKMNLANLSGLKVIQRFLYRSASSSSSLSQFRFAPPYILFFIPCFTESSELVRRTFDSLARSNYPDTRKLLFFVCDGLAKNKAGKETHVCILEALGYSSSEEPEVRAYISLGQGGRRVNYAKVYSGFYESGSNRVPFILVVKVGAVAESARVPGNRGKRDSMVIVLGFLERCTNLALHRITPLEFEIFNHFYHVLGIDPREIKYMLATDSDTQVQEDAVFKMVSRMEGDPKISAVSGHLKPANPEENVITMLQIFPIYLAFFSGLAYEAFLGRVTTFNGGFVMYRIWSRSETAIETKKGPKVSDEIIPELSTMKTAFGDDNSMSTDDNTYGTVNKVPYQRRYPPTRQEVPLYLAPSPSITLCCAHPTVLRGFAAAQPDTMHMENVLLLGEEQYFSLVLIRSLPEHRLAFEPEAIGYSVLSTNFFALQALMVRNICVSFHNQLEFQAMSRHLGVMYWLISFTKLVDMIFTVPLTCYLYTVFVRYFMLKSMAFAIIAGSFTCFIFLHIFYFLIRCQFKYILWFCIYCLFSVPIFHVYFPLLAIWRSDYANRWYDVCPAGGYGSRLHGIVLDETEDRASGDTVRMRLGDFEVLEAEKAALREKEKAEMLDAKFTGFTTGVVHGHANKPSWSSSSRSPTSLISTPPSAQLKTHSRLASEEDAMILVKTNPFLSALDDPFDDTHSARHPPSRSISFYGHSFSRSSYVSDPADIEHQATTTMDDNESVISLNPSLVTSVISLEQETFVNDNTTHEYDPHRIIRGQPSRTHYEEVFEGRSTPIHTKFASKYS